MASNYQFVNPAIGEVGISATGNKTATMLYYMTDEAKEFHRAQREKRKPDARKFPWLP